MRMTGIGFNDPFAGCYSHDVLPLQAAQNVQVIVDHGHISITPQACTASRHGGAVDAPKAAGRARDMSCTATSAVAAATRAQSQSQKDQFMLSCSSGSSAHSTYGSCLGSAQSPPADVAEAAAADVTSRPAQLLPAQLKLTAAM